MHDSGEGKRGKYGCGEVAADLAEAARLFGHSPRRTAPTAVAVITAPAAAAAARNWAQGPRIRRGGLAPPAAAALFLSAPHTWQGPALDQTAAAGDGGAAEAEVGVAIPAKRAEPGRIWWLLAQNWPN